MTETPPPDPEDRVRIEALFEAALELAPADRSTWLSERARSEPARHIAAVRRLLEAHERGARILDRGVSRVELSAAEPDPPRQVGPYRLLEVIGRGGMGVVHRAERSDGHYRSQVAVKLLRMDLGTGELARRFAAERQILAALDHPNIARLLDGGVTADGHSYLVMEYVPGVPILRHVLERSLDVEARLKLFLEVARGVQHAHGRLVIHRDLKPSNILVTPAGRLRLLDFGIAKVLDLPAAGFAESELPRTGTGIRLFTPDYASPEQIRGEPAATSNDIWALGVLLHELLTGARPFELSGLPAHEGERRILEDEPPRPSRVVDRPELKRRLEGDLDRIVSMALQKDPSRRYASVEHLGEDVQRHLQGLPVRAQPDRVGYRVGKFVRRHRFESVSAALVALSLMAGLVVALWQADRATTERDRAEQEATRAEAVSAYLLDLFGAADPWELPADRLSAREILARGERRLEALPPDPLLQAQVRLAIGSTYMRLGDSRSAQPLLETALSLRRRELGESHPLTAEAMRALADLFRRNGQFVEAEALALRALEAGRVGPVASRNAADPLHEAAALSLLGFIHTGMGRSEEAREDFEDELELFRRSGLEHRPEVGHVLINLAAIHRRLARFDDAEARLREALDHRTTHLGPDDPLTAVATARLAGLLSEHQGRPEEAAPLFQSALELQTRILGANHPARIESVLGLALIREGQGRTDEAESLHRESLRVHEEGLGPAHPSTLASAEAMASFLARTGRADEADSIFAVTVPALRAALGPLHPGLAGSLVGQGRARLASGRLEAAEEAFEEALRIRRQVFGDDHALVGLTLAELATVFGARGDHTRETELVSQGLVILERFHPPDHPETLALRARLTRLESMASTRTTRIP